jgi:hypothetical protein
MSIVWTGTSANSPPQRMNIARPDLASSALACRAGWFKARRVRMLLRTPWRACMPRSQKRGVVQELEHELLAHRAREDARDRVGRFHEEYLKPRVHTLQDHCRKVGGSSRRGAKSSPRPAPLAMTNPRFIDDQLSLLWFSSCSSTRGDTVLRAAPTLPFSVLVR